MNPEEYIEQVESADIEDLRTNFSDYMQRALDIEAGEEGADGN